jgi:enoyl-CoA hydratase
MTDILREDRNHGITILSLNRPEALNALSPALFMALRAEVDRIAQEVESVGCVILRGEGRSFSAGNDLKAIQAGQKPPSAHFQAETLEAIERLPQPVIAAVQGHCYTGSLELALACDLMITGESAKLADTHGKWGMAPTWGMSQRLPRRIGVVKAKEMMFSGRTISGQEAVELGIANQCVADDDLLSAAIEMAESFTRNSWHTLRADKALINVGQNRFLNDGLIEERENGPGVAPDMNDRIKAGFKR